MDEILIEEKKYVSSKRAAKMTGYAKDYIGQLCREGRVPARLVGRSWYVLESAIQDHRFGNEEVAKEPLESSPKLTSVYTRYEASSDELLPTVSRVELEEEPTASVESHEDVAKHLQDSWNAWFDHVEHSMGAVTKETVEDQVEIAPEVAEEVPMEAEEVSIPIQTIYKLPPQELLPTRRIEAEEPIEHEEEVAVVEKRYPVATIRVGGAVLAVLALLIATMGSGFLDTYVAKSSQVGMLAGVSVYNK
jgi:hypothetical protein